MKPENQDKDKSGGNFNDTRNSGKTTPSQENPQREKKDNDFPKGDKNDPLQKEKKDTDRRPPFNEPENSDGNDRRVREPISEVEDGEGEEREVPVEEGEEGTESRARK